MTEKEQLDTLRVYSNTELGLEDAIALLNARKVNFETDENELKKIRIELADKEAELAKIRARRIAFEEGKYAMRPPKPEEVDAIKAQADMLDRMSAQAETADTIVAAAKLLLQSWEASQV